MSKRPVFVILFVLFVAKAVASAGTAILRPFQSETALVAEGKLDCDLLSRLVLEETNRFRARHGLPDLIAMQQLMNASQDHATAMVRFGFFDHRNPVDRTQRDLSDRLDRAGCGPAASAENIAMNLTRDFREIQRWKKNRRGNPPPRAREYTYREFARSLVGQWIASRGHRANLLGGLYSGVGLGFAAVTDQRGFERVYCVQVFSS